MEGRLVCMETVTCNLCGSTSYRTIYQLSDWLLERPQVQTTLVKCLNCGLIYQNPRPTIEEMGQHYPPEYEPYNSTGQATSWLRRKAVEYGLDKRARAVTGYKHGGIILDIGCASGVFLHHMQQKFGWETHGVEVSEYAAQQAREKYGLDVFIGTLEQASFPENIFDAVTMWDVLEHLHDPSATFREIHRILKPGGVIALRVPNGDSFDARAFGVYWAGLDAPRHLYVFQKATIAQLLSNNGFDVLNITSRQASYMGFVMSVRMWMNGKGVNPRKRDTITRWLYHPVARLASAPLFYLYGLLEHSTQLTVAAKVKE